MTTTNTAGAAGTRSAAPGHFDVDNGDSGLKAHPLGQFETIGIIIGTNIGAGILSMAYAARKVGYIPLIACLAITCVLCIITMLYVAEASLRTKGNKQLSGLSRRYLGAFGGWLLFLAVAANSYGALVAYMSGSSNIMSQLLGDHGITREIASLIFLVPSALVRNCGNRYVQDSYSLVSGRVAALRVNYSAPIDVTTSVTVRQHRDLARLFRNGDMDGFRTTNGQLLDEALEAFRDLLPVSAATPKP